MKDIGELTWGELTWGGLTWLLYAALALGVAGLYISEFLG